MRGFFSRLVLTVFILSLAAFPVLMIFLPNKQHAADFRKKEQLAGKVNNGTVSVPSVPVITPTTVTKPVPIVSTAIKTSLPLPTSIAYVEAVDSSIDTAYTSNTVIANSFSFTVPSFVQVRYRNVETYPESYQFTFTKNGQTQGMTITLFSSVASVDAFIAQYYDDKLQYDTFGNIGKYTLYRLTPKNSLAASNPLSTTFGTQGLILGKAHSYTISFDANADRTMIDMIEKTVWNTCIFK